MAGASARRRVPNTSSRCVVESVTGTHDFVVANYSLLDGHAGPGNSITSTTFTVGGHDWNLRFFPDGEPRDATGTTTSVFLHLCTRPAPRCGVLAKVTVRLVDRNGKESLVGRCNAPTRTFGGGLWHGDSKGWRRFFWKPLLRLPGCHCLVNDCLTIRCVLTVITPLSTEDKTTPVKVPPPELPGHLERALQHGRGADVAFDVGGREFSAHRFMLAARSPVFEAQLFGAMMEKGMELIKIVDMEPDIFEMLLHYIYTDSLPPCNAGGGGHDVPAMQHLLVAADRYGMDRLKLMCVQQLCRSIDVKTLVTMYALADRHQIKQLQDACFKFLRLPGMAEAFLGLANQRAQERQQE